MTLLPGERTAHSSLKLPLNLKSSETLTCNILKVSGIRNVLQKCKLIAWHECTMADKKSLDASDGSLQDLSGNITPFGNTLILLARDFLASHTCSSLIGNNRQNKCLPEIVKFVVTRKDTNINRKYACPHAKQLIR